MAASKVAPRRGIWTPSGPQVNVIGIYFREGKRGPSRFALVFLFIYAIILRVRIFKYKWFHRFANKEGITDNELREIVKQLEKGQFYADLGGGVYKMQLARSNEGKSGGYRVIVVFKSECVPYGTTHLFYLLLSEIKKGQY